jgi:hypothetical protein
MYKRADTLIRSDPLFERTSKRLGCFCNGIFEGKRVLISIAAVFLKNDGRLPQCALP